MRPVLKLAVVACLAIAGYVIWWTSNGPADPAADARKPDLEVIPVSERNPDANEPATPRESGNRARESVTAYDEQFDSANDLAPFAAAMHKQALEGDDAAQYWLFRALQLCGPVYDSVFNIDPAQPEKSPLRLDEAIADEEANPRMGVDEIRKMHSQCQQLRNVDPAQYGDADGWLKRAAQSGYPLAQLRRAAEVAAGLNGAAGRAEARELLMAAVKSGDAEVILHTGTVAKMLASGESERERHEWVWEVAACQRGAKCGPTADWVRALCAVDRKCEPHEAALDVIRRRVGAQMPEIEEEARSLNAHIDARKWDALGL